MPDDLDDEQLARVLAEPEAWSEQELELVLSLLSESLERLREMVFREPPADHLHVERLERSIDGYEEALGRYTATHS